MPQSPPPEPQILKGGSEARPSGSPHPHRRRTSLYDVVAGRVGLNGFLSREQLQSSNLIASAPEEYLIRRTNIPEQIVDEAAEVTDRISNASGLPDSDLLKAIHAYASDFYRSCNRGKPDFDSRSMDETALIAISFLLEELVKQEIGENGDMVFVEPEGFENAPEAPRMIKYQIQGRVYPPPMQRQPSLSDEDLLDQEQSPAKRPRR
ncbi:hypothetical protein PV10_02320 [Exophiala mesophila]|uniref:Uncharacterized protein n=1 Tax=Exophiala mesophila TaxID=212818 RepID=A0A0D1WYP0_EXOME|nr:uncharacterized protein PV10_02320 [Exophiala mesophila]KIV94565.1 hypothetical protein PV10_02320 [Exophiala mesophila]